jgi:hypothetical protein
MVMLCGADRTYRTLISIGKISFQLFNDDRASLEHTNR